MTEKQLKPDNKAQFIVKRVGFQYNVNKNSIEYDGKHFAYCNVEQNKIANKLNELAEENKALKKQLQSEHQQLENAILLERTRMGKNCLKQFRDAIQ